MKRRGVGKIKKGGIEGGTSAEKRVRLRFVKGERNSASFAQARSQEVRPLKRREDTGWPSTFDGGSEKEKTRVN